MNYGTLKPVRFQTAPGMTVVGNVWGKTSGTPVLLLHGGGQTRHSWNKTAQTLARNDCYCLTLDLRGHGDSDYAPDGDYRIDSFVRDVSHVVSFFPGPPVIVGASLGGVIALILAGESEQKVASGIVLVDVAPRVEDAGVERILSFMQSHREGFGSLEEAARAVTHYLRHRLPPDDVSGLEKNLRRGVDGRYRWHWDPSLLTNFNLEEARNQERLYAAARALTIPILLVRGLLSDVVSQKGVDEFLEIVPQAQHVDISGAAHTVAGDSNEAFTEVVLHFMGQLCE